MIQSKALRMSYYFAIYVLGYWLISSWFAVHVHVSLTPAFVAIYCLTNGRYPNLQTIYSGVLKVKKHFSDGAIITQSYTPTS